jgi:hypothetical protein
MSVAGWYNQSNQPTLLPCVSSDIRSGLRMITDTPVAKGAPLLAVPRSLLMSAQTARASPVCGALVESKGLDDWQVRGSSRRCG